MCIRDRPLIEEYKKLHSFHEIIPISALKRDGLDILMKRVTAALPVGPALDVYKRQSQGSGVEQLAEAISDYEEYLKKENLALDKSVQNWQERLIEMLRDTMLEKARERMANGGLAQYAAEVAAHKRDPYTLVEEIAANAGKS